MEVKPPRGAQTSRCWEQKAGGSSKQPWLVSPMARASKETPLEEATWDEHGPLASSWSLCLLPVRGSPKSRWDSSELVKLLGICSLAHCSLTDWVQLQVWHSNLEGGRAFSMWVKRPHIWTPRCSSQLHAAPLIKAEELSLLCPVVLVLCLLKESCAIRGAACSKIYMERQYN